MQEIDKPGYFYLGKTFNPKTKKVEEKPLSYEAKNLTTHAVCVGMTGSGKTGLGIDLLEEAGLNGIPALIIDPKGDLGNMMLTFPDLTADEFLPWIDTAEADRKHQTPEQFAANTAKTWKEGLDKWGESGARIKKLKEAVDVAIYTPANNAGLPLSILNSFAAPPDELLQDSGLLRERILSTVSGLLGLVGIVADPINSREHILLSTILDQAWKAKRDLDLPQLIQQIQKPPFDKVGVFDTETFYPQKDRLALAMRFNNLLASPGFQAWMEGEPLDIQNLLYTKGKKPRLAILTISHLSDSERMFFVTLLLNELVGWMRRQPGSSSLKALLYMDEIFGYFPPTASPPSKTPMLTLLKQARAFGLGIVLATQNPVDLDYKGLANCGTWFIGKLQTERDKARVLEGLNAASNGNLDAASMNKMIAAVGSRIFILRSVNLPEPVLFESRWTLSYLSGPLTLTQIQKLMAPFKGKAVSKETKAPESGQKPVVPGGISEFFYRGNARTYQPHVLATAKLHFVDAKSKVDTWQEYCVMARVENESVQWGENVPADKTLLDKTAAPGSSFDPLPACLMQAKNYQVFGKSFGEYLYQNMTLDLFQAPQYKMASQPGEKEEEFRQRVADTAGEKNDNQKIRDRYQAKISTLQERLRRAQEKASGQKSQVFRQKLDAFLSFITTLLGAFLGRGFTKGSISKAETSFRKVGRINREQELSSQADDSVESLQQQLADTQAAMQKELGSDIDPRQIDIEKTSIRPKKSDIAVESVSLVWS